MRVVATMLIGPGETHRYLDRTLRVASRWFDTLLVVGDRCDPDTQDAIRVWASHARHVDHGDFRESTLRNEVLALCDEHLTAGDLVVVLDADEELRTLNGNPSPRAALNELAADRDHDAWPVTFWHLWTPDGSRHRVDGAWQGPATRIYRHQPGLRLPDRDLGCPPVPSNLNTAPRWQLAIAHWGYARPHDRLAKHAHYMLVDGGRYHHLGHLESIITDPVLAEVPG